MLRRSLSAAGAIYWPTMDHLTLGCRAKRISATSPRAVGVNLPSETALSAFHQAKGTHDVETVFGQLFRERWRSPRLRRLAADCRTRLNAPGAGPQSEGSGLWIGRVQERRNRNRDLHGRERLGDQHALRNDPGVPFVAVAPAHIDDRQAGVQPEFRLIPCIVYAVGQ